jgi:hypothetical protein
MTSVFQRSVVPLGMTAVPSGGAAPARRTLSYTVQHQLQTQWCWAAVTSSVAVYYQNGTWPQCRVANDRLGRTTCCSEGSSAACNQPWFLEKALDRVGILSALTTGPLTLRQIMAEIDAGHPIGVRIQWSGGGAHFITIRGYSDQNIVDVEDPWYGHSSVDYAAFVSRYHGTGRWTHSYRTNPRGQHAAAAS